MVFSLLDFLLPFASSLFYTSCGVNFFDFLEIAILID